jgi:peroxiredoxin Q/BCP
MANRAKQKQDQRAARAEREAELARAQRARTLGMRVAAAVAVGLVALAAIFLLGTGSGGKRAGNGKAGQYKFAVGQPAPGAQAPEFQLPSTSGSTFDLASARGHKVLLYFQEGLSCQPCWDQLNDIEHQFARFRALGIDRVVTITSDPLDGLRQKVADEGLKTPVLSDSNLRVSSTYRANSYGMMGNSRDGHSFILVDARGTIAWRADYGGPPDFTMYLPVSNLLADIRARSKA